MKTRVLKISYGRPCPALWIHVDLNLGRSCARMGQLGAKLRHVAEVGAKWALLAKGDPKWGPCCGHVGSNRWIGTILCRSATCVNYHSPAHLLYLFGGLPQLKLHQWTEDCSNRSAPLLNYHASAPSSFGVGGFGIKVGSRLSFWKWMTHMARWIAVWSSQLGGLSSGAQMMRARSGNTRWRSQKISEMRRWGGEDLTFVINHIYNALYCLILMTWAPSMNSYNKALSLPWEFHSRSSMRWPARESEEVSAAKVAWWVNQLVKNINWCSFQLPNLSVDVCLETLGCSPSQFGHGHLSGSGFSWDPQDAPRHSPQANPLCPRG